MNFRKSATSGAKWTTLSKVVRSVFLLLQIAILTRYLDKSDFGLVAMCMFVVNFTNIFVDAGFTSVILHKLKVSPGELSTLYWTNLLLAISLFTVLVFLAPSIATFYDEARLTTLLPMMAINVIFIAIGRIHLTVMQKQLKFKKLAIVDIVSVVVGLTVATILAIFDYGIYSLIISTLVVSITSSIIGLFLNWSKNKIYFHFCLKELKTHFNVGSYSLGGQILGFLVTEIDTLIIGKLLGPTSLGIYDLAKNIASKLYGIISPIINKVLTPLLSQMQNDKANLKHYFTKVILLVSYFGIPIYFMIILGAKELLSIIYGSAYTDGYLILSFMAVFYCINTIYNPINSLQIATGKTRLGFFWALLCLFIYPLGILISASWGIDSVAFVRSAISISLIYMMWKLQVKNMIDIQWHEFIRVFWKPLVLFLSLSGFFLCYGMGFNSKYQYLNLLLNIIIGTIVFLILIFVIDRKRVIFFYSQLKAAFIKKEL